jgi:hypothetical protein
LCQEKSVNPADNVLQVTVGLPPDHEVILSPGQLKSRDLRRIIHNAYGGDESMAMLTQVANCTLGTTSVHMLR